MPADLIAAWQRFSLRWRGRVVGAVLLAAAVLGLWTTAQAAISYVAAASNASGGQVSSIVINRPAGTAANDLLVAALAQDGAGTISAPAGWVQRLASNGTRLPQLVIFTKVATGSEAASYTFTSTVSQEFAGGIMSYRGVDTTSPIDASAISANAASTSSLAPSITTTTTNTVLVAFWACADADITPPGTMTVPFNAVAGSGASSVNVAGAYQTQAAAGATGSRTAALQNSLVSNGAMLALRSAGAAITVSGTVFEDRNYGGGAGRSLATSGGSGVTGARVELYNGSGAYLQATTTAAGGGYSFSGLTASTTYYVRVVSGSVASTRTGSSGSLVGVMTYRAAANAGTAAGVADYVGGSNPALVDPGNGAGGTSFNTSSGVFSAGLSGTAQAFSQATAAVVDLTGIDFGFNFSTVVNTNDAGQGSLRQAITNANTLGGDASLAQSGRTAAVENLVFMIPNGTGAAGLRSGNNAFAGGVATIAPGSALPVLSTSMVIDAQTQPGWSASPVLQLNGSSMGGVCLAFSAGSSTLRGWIINRCTSDALSVYGGSTHIFQGNWIGLDSAGTTASAASGSSANAISLSGVSAVLIGGTSAAQRNVLSGNTYAGIYIGSTTTALAITGNYIGTNAAGTAAVANAVGGIRWASSISGTSGVTVGGTAAGQGNVISGNTGIGVRVTLGAPTLNGNIIGLNAAGTAALPNTSGGIQLLTNVNGAVIGGTSAAARNVISGNTGAGISAASGTVTNVTVQGNYIGSNAAGSAALANSGDGIDVQVGTSISIGGTAAGSGNLIMGNGGRGVNVRGSSSGISILGNSITGNGNIGIDLGNDGVTVNDGAKTAGQPNLLMDTPVITSASLSGTTLTLAGYVGSAAGQSTFASSRVEFFVSDLDASGYGEGQAYIGALTTDASGNFSGSITVPGGVTVTSGSTKLSATATDGSNNTSEFGANFALGPVISGSVFEDIHYGGGAGRTLAASGGAAVAGATVELYNSSGGYVSSTTTAGDGSKLLDAAISIWQENNS